MKFRVGFAALLWQCGVNNIRSLTVTSSLVVINMETGRRGGSHILTWSFVKGRAFAGQRGKSDFWKYNTKSPSPSPKITYLPLQKTLQSVCMLVIRNTHAMSYTLSPCLISYNGPANFTNFLFVAGNSNLYTCAQGTFSSTLRVNTMCRRVL